MRVSSVFFFHIRLQRVQQKKNTQTEEQQRTEKYTKNQKLCGSLERSSSLNNQPFSIHSLRLWWPNIADDQAMLFWLVVSPNTTKLK